MIQLMTTDGCHLCEQAIGMFYYAKQQQLIDQTRQLELVDIVTNEQQVEVYGERIPVLVNSENGDELGWPFELNQMIEWINRQ